jgi:histidinol phosphatase-like enzyme
VLVTNPAGIARGYVSESVLPAVDESPHAQLVRAGARLDGLDAVDRVLARPVAA